MSLSDRPAGTVRGVDRALAAVLRAARWLAVAVAALLFLQWPLREWIQAYSREANDLAQVLFAFYVALAVTAATRTGAHLAVDARVAHYAPRRRARTLRIATAVVVLPAAVALLIVAAMPVYHSVRALEAFPETYNPGYFALKIALAALTFGVLLQAIVDLFNSPGRPR